MYVFKYNTQMLIKKNFTYYKNWCLIYIYMNPNSPNNTLICYRIILGIFCIYNFIINNWLDIPEYLEEFLIKYINEFCNEFNVVNMFPGGWNPYKGHSSGYHQVGPGYYDLNPYGQGPSGGPSGGGSHVGPPPGDQSSREQNEDSNRSRDNKRNAPDIEENEVKRKRPNPEDRTRFPPRGPKFLYFDHEKNRLYYPETFHRGKAFSTENNCIRQYEEHGLSYIYVWHTLIQINIFVVYYYQMEIK